MLQLTSQTEVSDVVGSVDKCGASNYKQFAVFNKANRMALGQ